MPISEARARANKKYLDKVESILVRVKPEMKRKITAHAKANGESVNGFIVRAISETIEREK